MANNCTEMSYSNQSLPEEAAELARKGDTAGLAALIKGGLAVDAQDAKGNTPLMLAAYHGKAATVALLGGGKPSGLT